MTPSASRSVGKSLTDDDSGDGKAAFSVSDQGHGPKIGRKGDPRMHQAVAARLANPNLSLFGALKAGGFQYEDDNDPSAVDSENIALCQRKNQLSRRLRLASKKFDNKKIGSFDESFDESRDKNDSAKVEPKKRSAGKQLKLLNSAATADGKKSRLSSESEELPKTREKADAASISTATDNAVSKCLKDHQLRLSQMLPYQAEEPKALPAKFHPDFHQIIRPRAPTLNLSNSPSTLDHLKPAAQSTPEIALQEQLMANGFTGGLSGFALAVSKSQGSMALPSVSNVAVRSLNATAKSVGITLEQLALVLSTSKNLMQLLSGLTGEGGSDPEGPEKKRDLALRLHEYETRTLYSRCMLLAGYTHEDAGEGASAQLRFALEAWKREGKRLQELLRNKTDVTCDEAPLIHNVADKDTVASLQRSQLIHQQLQQQQAQQEQQIFQQMQQSINSGRLAARGSSLSPLTNTTSKVHPFYSAASFSQSTAGTSHTSHVNPSPHKHTDSTLNCQYSDGRHVHRLAGKCGHRAILHQPEGGVAHIDFVVGDKVECYGGLNTSPGASSDGNVVWPSRYRCDELDCTQAEQCSKAYVGEHQHSTGCAGTSNKAKILDLNRVDLSGKEWTIDFNDDLLMSLFSLGNTGGSDCRSVDSEQKHQL